MPLTHATVKYGNTDSAIEPDIVECEVQVVHKERKTSTSKSQYCSLDVIQCLLKSMKKVGYEYRNRAGKSMEDSLETAVARAKMEGVDHIASAWERKFSRLKSDYSKFMIQKSKCRSSGQLTLKRKPHFFEEMYKLEYSNARHDRPVVIDSGQDVVKFNNEEK